MENEVEKKRRKTKVRGRKRSRRGEVKGFRRVAHLQDKFQQRFSEDGKEGERDR